MILVQKNFEELTLSELYALLKLRVDIFVVEQQCPYEELDDRDRRAMHLFFEKDGEILGGLRILPKGETFDTVAIGRLAVRKDARNLGLARKLMLQAIDYIENVLEENKIKISAQTYLISFYESLGFQPLGETYLEDGIPHVDMER